MATFYRTDGWVKAVTGQAVSGAQIYVCNQPANTVWPIDPVTRKQVPNWQPTPQAAIYADVNGLQAIQQPIFTDGFGHYAFYTLTGFYTLVVINNGAVQQVYTDQTVGLPGLVIPPSGNVSGSNLVSNTIILGGGGSSIVSGPLLTGDTTKFLNGAGVFSAPFVLPNDATKFLNGTGVFSVPPAPSTMTNTVGGLVPTPPNDVTKFLNGAGAFSVPPEPVQSASATGPFFIGPGILSTQAPATSIGNLVAGGGVGDRIRICRFMLPIGMVVGRCSIAVNSNSNGTCSFAIYSSDGSSRLVYSGTFTGLQAAPILLSNTFAPVSLPAGTYWFAQTDASGSGGYGVTVFNASAGLATLLRGSTTRDLMGRSSTTATSGALPASISVTALTDDGDSTIAAALWESQ